MKKITSYRARAGSSRARDRCGGRAAGKTMADVLAASKPSDWRTLDPENTLYMELAGGRVVIELAPEFAPLHVANVRTLVRGKYFDGLAIVRSQDNFVVQWGDPADADHKKPLGAGKKTLHRGVRSRRRGLAVHRAAGSGHVCAADRIRFRLSRRARQGGWHRVARALLQHGRRRSRQRRGQRRRHRDLRGLRPCAAPARSQRHAVRACRAGHGVAGSDAARNRSDGLLRQAGAAHADSRDPRRCGCARGAANQAGSSAHRHADVHGSDRGAPQPAGRVVQVSAPAASTCATCRCR